MGHFHYGTVVATQRLTANTSPTAKPNEAATGKAGATAHLSQATAIRHERAGAMTDRESDRDKGATLPAMAGGTLSCAGFGGGCHWCTEAVFAALRGVTRVRQGFIRSHAPDDSFSEAVLVTFDPARIPFRTLIEIHLRTHASTSDHSMRGKYRSAIYTCDPDQADAAAAIIADLRAADGAGYVTRILPCVGFRPSDPRFHRYGERNAGKPFCTRYIDPKLARLRDGYAEFLRPQGEDR